MDGFLIAEIGCRCRCRLASQAYRPSWLCSWLPLPPYFPNLSSFMISILVAVAALSPKLVSIHDFPLGCRCGLVYNVNFPLLGATAALFATFLLAAAAALSPKLVYLHNYAFGCCRRLVSQVCFPSLSPALGCRYRPSLTPFMISFLAITAALSPKLKINPKFHTHFCYFSDNPTLGLPDLRPAKKFVQFENMIFEVCATNWFFRAEVLCAQAPHHKVGQDQWIIRFSCADRGWIWHNSAPLALAHNLSSWLIKECVRQCLHFSPATKCAVQGAQNAVPARKSTLGVTKCCPYHKVFGVQKVLFWNEICTSRSTKTLRLPEICNSCCEICTLRGIKYVHLQTSQHRRRVCSTLKIHYSRAAADFVQVVWPRDKEQGGCGSGSQFPQTAKRKTPRQKFWNADFVASVTLHIFKHCFSLHFATKPTNHNETSLHLPPAQQRTKIATQADQVRNHGHSPKHRQALRRPPSAPEPF